MSSADGQLHGRGSVSRERIAKTKTIVRQGLRHRIRQMGVIVMAGTGPRARTYNAKRVVTEQDDKRFHCGPLVSVEVVSSYQESLTKKKLWLTWNEQQVCAMRKSCNSCANFMQAEHALT